MTGTNRFKRPATAGLGVALALALTVPPLARADIAGTGTFDLNGSIAPPSSVSFDGTITFDAGTRTVGSTPVDLASDVGAMSYAGLATINLAALSATFELTAEDTTVPPVLAFAASGGGACVGNCLGGMLTFAGSMTSITDPGGVLPTGYVYTFDGTITLNGTGDGLDGAVAINAFPEVATPSGSNVGVPSGPTTFYDSRAEGERTFDARLLFDTVTGAGTTSFVGLTAVPGTLPDGITLDEAVSTFIDVVTTASYTGPLQVCISVPDGDMDGIVDGTTIPIALLRVLHSATVGDAFLDVTTPATGAEVCGQVTSNSPFVLGVAPAEPTTTTTITTTTVTSTSTTTTTIAALVGGGKKASADCYLELKVAGIENPSDRVQANKTVLCTDGEACDSGPCGDNRCDLQVAACINQTDPNLAACVPPANLSSAKIKNKLNVQVPQLLEGPVCGAFVQATVEAKLNTKGKYLKKKSKQTLKGKAKAPQGTNPRTDTDQWIIQCLPRTVECPAGSASGAFLE